MLPITQPLFWLQVKREYLFENFENLLHYLHQYKYMDKGRNNSDYDATVNCMLETSTEYVRQLYAHSLFLPIDGEVDFDADVTLVTRMIAATVLAERKRGHTPSELLAALICIVSRTTSHLNDDVTVGLYRLLCSCMKRSSALSVGYSWADIEEANFSVDVMALKLSKVPGCDVSPSGDMNYYLEHNGVFLIPSKGLPVVAPVNLDTFRCCDMSTLADMPDIARLMVERRYYDKCSDFDLYYHELTKLFSQQMAVKKSSARRLKEYTRDTDFFVRVTRKRGYMVEAETIDVAYERMSGKVDLTLSKDKGQIRPSLAIVASTIREGDCLYVSLCDSDEFTFEIYNPFEDFYRQHAITFADTETWALFETDYGKGKSFITEDGVRASVDREKLDKLSREELEELDYAILHRQPVRLKFYAHPPRTDGEKFVMYAFLPALGEEYGTEEDADTYFTSSDADKVMVTDFIDWCNDEAAGLLHSASVDFIEADRRVALPLLVIFDRILRSGVPEARKRLEYAACGAMLARILDREVEFDYFEHWCRYVHSQVMFALDKEVKPITVKPSISNCAPVLHHVRVNNILSRYRRMGELKPDRTVTDEEMSNEALETRLCALVNASNDLIDILDEQELNNIKRAIAHDINVLDEFVPIVDNKTFYGTESLTLEFKTSVVFPPANRRRYASAVADPDIQRWAIIKAVGGFLNTRSGGEILLGVGDSGYATGLTSDMEKLAELGKIPFANMDHYRIYVENILDFAFREEGAKEADSDISRTRITYQSETNAEGAEILRIKVKPYEKAVVFLAAGAQERPDTIEDAYIRFIGRTLPVTPALREEIMRYKSAKNRK